MASVEKYVEQLKAFYDILLAYIENENEDERDYVELIIFFQSTNFDENSENIREMLQILVRILNNHHPNPTFFNKIGKILLFYKDKIKQTLSNSEIFDIFQNNKRILLFLLNNKIIELDQYIIDTIYNKSESNGVKYRHYFSPEIQAFGDEKKKVSVEKEMSRFDPEIIEQFEEKRQLGENGSYICSLIRNDSVRDFISYVNRANIPLFSRIKNSIYETNSFLTTKQPSLIEYAAFFGAVQIFQYLRMNNVEMTKSLWLFVIHSNNADLIHILEENHIEPEDKSFRECYKESIKCHHNNIANYIESVHLNDNDVDKSYLNDIKTNPTRFFFHYHNYSFFPENLNDKFVFHYLCLYNYVNIVKLLVKLNKVNINEKKNNIEILNILLNHPTVNIVSDCFKKCSRLKQIKLTPFIKTIESSAFFGCTSLSNILIPSSVTDISQDAFYGCISLQEIILPPSIKYIGPRAFNGCCLLKRVTIPSSVTVICEGTFKRCSSLTEVVIPTSITRIENNAFNYCISLQHISIPSTVKQIDDQAFEGCSALLDFSIPSSIKNLGKAFLLSCVLVKEIVIPQSITSIEDSSLQFCSSLTKVIIPQSVTSIGVCSFRGCHHLEEIIIPPKVTSIGESAFSGCSLLKKIIIPSLVTKINSSTFYECSSLEEVISLSEITFLGSHVFDGCKSLKTIPKITSLKQIFEYTFSKCSSLTSFKMPSDVTNIGECAFQRCSLLTEIDLPSQITSIGKGAFGGCSMLKKIVLPNIEIIEDESFMGCFSLESVVTNSKIKEIRNNAFQDCKSLKEISFPSEIKKMGNKVFKGCTSLVSFHIHYVRINESCFEGCTSLVDVVLPSYVQEIETKGFANCTSLRTIKFNTGNAIVSSYAFYGCKSLKQVFQIPGATFIISNLPPDVQIIEKK